MQRVLSERGLDAAIHALHETVIQTGHIQDGWQRHITHRTHTDENDQVAFYSMVNHGRSHYSRTYSQPAAYLPEGALCKICPQNVADPNNSANVHLRTFDMTLNGEAYFIQPPPYPYGECHVMLIEHQHRDMHHDEGSVKANLEFLDGAPAFTVCQNSDIHGAGATIPQHHHVPVMRNFSPPVMSAQPLPAFHLTAQGVELNILDYPFTTIKVTTKDKDTMAKAVASLIGHWKQGEKGRMPNRTANYIMRKGGDEYCAWVFMRDVSYQPTQEFLTLKSEYCGYIDIAGCPLLSDKKTEAEQAVFLARLEENPQVAQTIRAGLKQLSPLSTDRPDEIHSLLQSCLADIHARAF
ncbi:hypothetical protein [Sansalvadorimonas verongulae]|uniref:hypothetical protein n=1 Tax=Sansalvadorimonas verongulae TaxID=2172824 RepID=UPI0012BD0541|nr:hypothetical protein [Sansalvadorimonas verongulae]MTI15065.1 hypothetical protein [Sansalvadorimonas verongulae]